MFGHKMSLQKKLYSFIINEIKNLGNEIKVLIVVYTCES